MGIESDQLVYDYLSRVGDIAQQRALPSGQRMRLVNELRASIDKVRAAEGAHSVSAVKQVLARFGSPADIVEAAKQDPASAVPEVAVQPGEPPAGGGGLASRLPRPRVGGSEKWLGRLPRPRGGSDTAGQPGGWPPGGRTGGRSDGRAGGRPGGRSAERSVPEPAAADFTPPAEPPPTAASPPHLAGEDELDATHAGPDWWRVEPGPFGGAMPGGAAGSDTVPGFTGGIELPEILKPPEKQDGGEEDRPRLRKGDPGAAAKARQDRRAEAEDADDEDEDGDGVGVGVGVDEDDGVPAPYRRGSALRDLLRSAGPLEVLAIAALLAGAVLGQWVAAVVGWLLAYASRRLTMAEKKWAALGVPGTVAFGGLAWLWGRFDERWGEPIKEGTMGQEMTDLFPVVVRVAAVASALFLLWRARRRLRA